MNHKNNISSNMSTFSKLTNFNRGGVFSTCNSNSLTHRDIDNAKGGLCLHSGMIRLAVFMFFSILILTSCSNTENDPKPQQIRHSDAFAVEELVYDTVCPTDSILLD